jgi:hypothetical protein
MLAVLLIAAACASTRSGRFMELSGFVQVTVEKAAIALRAGQISLDTAKKIYRAYLAADAALDLYAKSLITDDPRELREAAWDAAERAVVALAELAQEFLGDGQAVDTARRHLAAVYGEAL